MSCSGLLPCSWSAVRGWCIMAADGTGSSGMLGVLAVIEGAWGSIGPDCCRWEGSW